MDIKIMYYKSLCLYVVWAIYIQLRYKESIIYIINWIIDMQIDVLKISKQKNC